jgi:hypothetical protein
MKTSDNSINWSFVVGLRYFCHTGFNVIAKPVPTVPEILSSITDRKTRKLRLGSARRRRVTTDGV